MYVAHSSFSLADRMKDDEATDAICRKAITHIIALLTDPNAPPPPDMPVRARSPVQVVVPAHLQDLREGDLPEEQRVVVLDQIAIFRENAARREREKKIMEEEKDRFKAMEARKLSSSPGGKNASSGTEGYGYGNRNLARGQQAPLRQWGAPQQRSPQQQNGVGPSKGQTANPQGYSDPVHFVRPQAAEAKGESERTDEEEEDIRRQRRDRERDVALREVCSVN